MCLHTLFHMYIYIYIVHSMYTQYTKTHCTVQLHGQLFSQLCFSARPCLASLAAPGNKWNIGNTVRHVETLYKDVNVWIPLTPDLWCRSFLKTMLLSLELFHQKPVSISATWQNCPREGTTSHESNSDCIKYVKEPAGSFTKIQLSIDFHTHIWMTVWYSMMINDRDFPWNFWYAIQDSPGPRPASTTKFLLTNFSGCLLPGLVVPGPVMGIMVQKGSDQSQMKRIDRNRMAI